MPPTKSAAHDHQAENKQKKRHRHSTEQLVALNELYEQDEHPALQLRTALAAKIGMETKTVNAWFQNKRASNRKRTRGSGSRNNANSKNQGHPPQSTESQEHSEDEYYPPENVLPMTAVSSLAASEMQPHASMAYSDPSYFAPPMSNEHELHRPHLNLAPEQIDELLELFSVNPHPTKHDRELFGDRIGLRYSTVTLWFQAHRSDIRRLKSQEGDFAGAARYAEIEPSLEHYDQTYSPSLLPGTYHPSLPYPPPTLRSTRSSSVTPSSGSSPSRRSASTPYAHGVLSTMSQRARRTRPEAHQLDALKDLFNKTQHPTIEERTALAMELGMDIRKVTNWFRNLRQTSRKRARKGRSDDEDDNESYSSRFRSPSGSLSAFEADNERRMYGEMAGLAHKTYSDMESDDDYQEAVTPSPEHSPSPPPETSPVHYSRHHPQGMSFNHAALSPIDKAAFARYAHINYEDAMLLLDFHQHIVHLT